MQKFNFFLKYWYVLVVLVCIGSIPAIAKADQTISVTGAVPPQASDFQLTATNDTVNTIAQNHIVTYTITYGSHLDYADHFTLEAYWDKGTIHGAGSATVDPMDYISGSASNAYNSTSPVVDLTNNKISWSISSFPAQTTNQSVTFQLK